MSVPWPARARIACLGSLLASVLGGILCYHSLAEARVPARGADILALSGPLRGLALPFLWSSWGEAEREQEGHSAAASARWLTLLMPEREDLYLGFGWDRAYRPVPPGPARPEIEARGLLDGLSYLDEAASIHRESGDALALASFVILDRCLGPRAAPERRLAFERLRGSKASELAEDYLGRARERTGLEFRLGTLGSILALRFLEEGRYHPAARLLLKTAETLRALPSAGEEERERAKRLASMARTLESKSPLAFDPDLRNWLRQDGLFGRWIRKLR